MKSIGTLILVFVLSSPCFGQVLEPDFRKTTWGMSSEDVKRSENADLLAEIPDSLIYTEKFWGFDGGIFYTFTADALVRASHHIQESLNQNKQITFEKLRNFLTLKYGKPISDEAAWRNDFYKDQRPKWTFGVSERDLFQGTIWETDRTCIILTLVEGNFIGYHITYIGKDFAGLYQTEMKAKSGDDPRARFLLREFNETPHMIDSCALKIAHQTYDPKTDWPAYCNKFRDTDIVKGRVKEIRSALASLNATQTEKEKIKAGKIWIRATPAMAELSWGKPEKVNRTITGRGTSEQWVYGSSNYLYFVNGRLTTIQN